MVEFYKKGYLIKHIFFLLLLAFSPHSIFASTDDNTSAEGSISTWINRLFMSQEELEGKEPEHVPTVTESISDLFKGSEEVTE